MAGTTDHYATLGVPVDASLDDIKKRYRSLARTLHPDVNPGNAAATARFATVTESYRVLSDPVRRSAYDAQRALDARAAARSASSQRPGTGPTPSRQSTPRPGPAPGTSPAQEAALLAEKARRAFSQNRMGDAREMAERALRYASRNADAHEVLGDVFRQQGRTDDAFKHYTICLQLNPRNPAISARLERMAKESQWRAERAATENLLPNRPDKRSLILGMIALFGYALATVLILINSLNASGANGARTLGFPWVDTWTPSHLGTLLAVGGCLGLTQSASCTIRRAEDDFLLTGGTVARPASTPLGVVILFLGGVQYLLATVVHLLTSLVQETLHRSLAVVYGSIAVATLALAFTNGPATMQTLWWGGNVVFVAHLRDV